MFNADKQHIAIVPAAGAGTRFGADIPKQYTLLAQRPLIYHTVKTLSESQIFNKIYVAVSKADPWIHEALDGLRCDNIVVCESGGLTRAQTVMNTLLLYQSTGGLEQDWIWVHDAARPGITKELLNRVKTSLNSDVKAVMLATPVADTLKLTDEDGKILNTVSRQNMWQAQTPQVSTLACLTQALSQAIEDGLAVTDEASALEHIGVPVHVIPSENRNFKVTHVTDAHMMETLLPNASPKLRVGEGMDVHALVVAKPLILGGVHIPYSHGLLGHSDADALCHALIDALLGAAGLGDIGQMFPDTDVQFAGADSTQLLARAYAQVQKSGWKLVNADATIIAQAPKLAPHIPAIKARLSEVLTCAPEMLNIKAKTNENLGFLGRKEGIECRVTVLLIGH